MPGVSFQSRAVGVAHPEQPLALVRGAHACSWQIGGPAGISSSLQIKPYSGEPLAPIARCNLLANDHCRAALGDEAEKSGPEVSFVGRAVAASDARKRLTGTR